MTSIRSTKLVALTVLVGMACLPVSDSSAQSVVQLPTFTQFGYSGTVWVPVGGSTLLGSNARAASGLSSRGGLGLANRARGGTLNLGAATAHVTVIDLDEMDRRIRGVESSVPVASLASKDHDAEGKAIVRYARSQYRAGKHASAFDAYQLAFSKLSPKLAKLAQAEFRRVFPSGRRPVRPINGSSWGRKQNSR